MKKFFIAFFSFLLFSLAANAQISVKEGSFKEVEGFVNIDDKQYDENGTSYAVIKVRTENITDKERRELSFHSDANTSIEFEYKDGEVWIYITYLASKLKISHPEFGTVNFDIPIEMKPKCGYEMLLSNKVKASVGGWGSITINTKPESGATVTINGKVLKMTTPYVNNMIAKGKYEIKVSLEKYRTVTKTIEVKNADSLNIEIDMPPICGKISVITNIAGAEVYIDNKLYGTAPMENQDVIIGSHQLKIVKDGWITLRRLFDLEETSQLTFNEVLVNCPVGAISELYRIGNSNYVFSKGNLQYNASTKTWRFAEHQWDFVGNNNKNISPTYNDWIDLFGWGTGNNPTNTSEKDEDYPSYSEWGKNHISNGGGRANKWEVLSGVQWEYLTYISKTESNIKFVKANVNGVNGVVLFPDLWIKETYKLNGINDNESPYNTNKISLSEWESLFETNGAVFLPAAGKRYNKSVFDTKYEGRYWSSSNLTPKNQAIFVKFGRTHLFSGAHDNRGLGFSVRLVCNVDNLISKGTYNIDVLKKPECGKINITTNPSGASVYIDDIKYGVTPFEIDKFTIGPHELTIIKEGYISLKKQFVLEDGQTLSFNETLDKGLDGVIDAVFSVSPTEKVCFSKGNLQYRAQTKTWRFAENQWDIVGNKKANQTNPDNGWRDLFGCGTGRNPMNTSNNTNDYKSFSDWGNNAIFNGGNRPNLWRTLTKDEWIYLCDKRKTKSGIRFAKAVVNNVQGIILLPDTWNKKAYKFEKANNNKIEYYPNTISASDWTEIFEKEGAVFLPNAGYRTMPLSRKEKNMLVMGVDFTGYYWSSTRNNNDINKAQVFAGGLCYDISTCNGCSVRLVCPEELVFGK